MVRPILGVGLVAVFVGLVGCTMCCHTDYRCGPVYDNCGRQCCCPPQRAGSILESGGQTAPADVAAKRNLKRAGTPGSEPAVATKDRAVKPAQKPSGKTVARTPQPDQESTADGPEISQPSADWTARRPDGSSRQ